MTPARELLEESANTEPAILFRRWFAEAQSAGLVEPSAMALATADAAGMPSVRMVLLKQFDERGLVFFTNYDSRKGRELSLRPQAEVLLWWDRLERQIRVRGRVERLDRAESETYFHSRPRGSQLSALASPQSRPVPDRAVLERTVQQLERTHAGQAVPLPENWGGLCLRPDYYEFWQGRSDRLHDRLTYTAAAGGWRRERLAP